MKTLQLSTLILTLSLSLGLSLTPFAAHAQQAGNIEVKNVAEVETEVKDAKGKVTIKRAPAAKVVPGSEVIYTTTFKNLGSKAAGNIVINNPLPLNTTLTAGSVFGANTNITYSLDGKVFATPDKLKVTSTRRCIHARPSIVWASRRAPACSKPVRTTAAWATTGAARSTTATASRCGPAAANGSGAR